MQGLKGIRGGAAIAIAIAVVGLAADATTLLGDGLLQDIAEWWPLTALLAAACMAVLLRRQSQQLRHHDERQRRFREARNTTWRRVVRVLASDRAISAIPDVESGRLGPLLDELAGLLPPDFGTHHKFSVARPNADGSFTLLATRGMDPAAVRQVESQANWKAGRSFYASMMTDPDDRLYKVFGTSDTAYIDTRTLRDNARRQSSSAHHFIVALRDPDTYEDLPCRVIGVVSIGLPKSMAVTEGFEDELFAAVEPACRAIEVVLLAESLRILRVQGPDG